MGFFENIKSLFTGQPRDGVISDPLAEHNLPAVPGTAGRIEPILAGIPGTGRYGFHGVAGPILHYKFSGAQNDTEVEALLNSEQYLELREALQRQVEQFGAVVYLPVDEDGQLALEKLPKPDLDTFGFDS